MISRRLLRIKAMHIAYAYFNSEDGNIKFFENELKNSIQNFYDLYLAFFSLIVEVKDFANYIIELRKGKLLASEEDLNPNLRFVENRVIADLENIEEIKRFIETNNMIWKENSNIIKVVYNALVESDVYEDYMKYPASSYSHDKQIVYYILEQILPDNEDLYQLLEEMSIYWNDDIELVLSMNIRTVQRMKASKSHNNKLFPLYKTKDDKEFVKTLFRNTVANHERSQQVIAELSDSWENDRIALIDMTIMELAITELISFPLLPIPVTLNEYIDMAKFYSTEKSHIFVNGILEKAIIHLTEKGLIKKRGAGLLNSSPNERDDE